MKKPNVVNHRRGSNGFYTNLNRLICKTEYVRLVRLNTVNSYTAKLYTK